MEQRYAASAGDMTAAMRAVTAPKRARLLRVCAVREGAIVDERLCRAGDRVTLGAAADATFVVATDTWLRELGAQAFPLFEHTRDGYVLSVLLPEMSGRVALERGAVALEELCARAERVRRGTRLVHRVVLPPRARGRISVGAATILFQMIAAPVARPRSSALLVPNARKSWSDIDWTTTIVAACSFLAHFAGVAVIYSDWLDPIADDEVRATQLLEASTVVPQPRVELPPTSTAAEASSAAGAAATHASDAPRAPVAQVRATPTGLGPSATPRLPGGARGGESRIERLVGEFEQMEMTTLGVWDTLRPFTGNVLGDGEIPIGSLDAIAHRATGSGPAAGLHIRTEPDTVVPSTNAGDVATIGERGAHGDAPSAAAVGSSKRVEGPKLVMSAAAQQVGGAVVKNAQGVIGRLHGQFRHCYESGSPELEGAVTLVVRVGPNGEVRGVSGGGGPLAPIVPCLATVLQGAAFSAPADGVGAIIQVPFVFRHQAEH